MKSLLQKISKEAISLNPNFFTNEEKTTQWIGRNPATNEGITEAEKKLGITLPDDVVELYKTSNGTSVILNQCKSAFMQIEQIDWLKNADPYLIECYAEMGEAYVNDLKNSIIIAGINYCHSILLIQPYGEHTAWRYWDFASYYPGEHVIEGIQKYLEELINFLSEQNKDS
jgi:SMI1 / KNR4 family (SUKH-1)